MDKDCFTERIVQLEGMLYAVARTHFPSVHDCADAVQETVLRAWKSRHTLKNDAHFKTWLVRIEINVCRSMYRKHSRVVVVERLEEKGMEAADPMLYEGVLSLDIRHRLPFVLYHVEGYSIAEVAMMLRVPRGTVLSRLHRARRKLREVYGEEVTQHAR